MIVYICEKNNFENKNNLLKGFMKLFSKINKTYVCGPDRSR